MLFIRFLRNPGSCYHFLTAEAAEITLAPVNVTGFAMPIGSKIKFRLIKRLLLGILMSFAASSVGGQAAEVTPVNIFGDGNPENGVEDSREPVMGGRRDGEDLPGQGMNAGAVKCDGKIRGTAMVVDTRELTHSLKGVVLASAAHVLYDLDRKQRIGKFGRDSWRNRDAAHRFEGP